MSIKEIDARINELQIVVRRANGLMETPQLKRFLQKRMSELQTKRFKLQDESIGREMSEIFGGKQSDLEQREKAEREENEHWTTKNSKE